jgi:hypothetical protein
LKPCALDFRCWRGEEGKSDSPKNVVIFLTMVNFASDDIDSSNI